MKIVAICTGKLALAALLAGCFLAAATIPARAGLGDDATSIESDAAAMQGKMSQSSPQQEMEKSQSVEQSASYSMQEFVADNGVTVREYAAPSGRVFGVAWQGRRPPNLNVLLGSYYSEYAAASKLKGHASLHHEVIEGPNSIVVLGGRMGQLVGRAYAPSLAPSGVDPKAVVK